MKRHMTYSWSYDLPHLETGVNVDRSSLLMEIISLGAIAAVFVLAFVGGSKPDKEERRGIVMTLCPTPRS